jgi:hypothetical protein
MNGISPHPPQHDLSASAKVSWLIFVIVLPFAYLIVRGAHLGGEQVATANAPRMRGSGHHLGDRARERIGDDAAPMPHPAGTAGGGPSS